MKNIVLCSDGTGNSGGKARGTNVWRIYNAVDRQTDPPQVAFYDDGVGTDQLRWLKVLGGAFGWGLSRNLRELYAALVLSYEPGDRVFLFGFSRGAFTVRSLAGMITACGLLDRDQYLKDPKRAKQVKRVLRAYRAVKPERAEAELLGLQRRKIDIQLIGVWDTVDAVGVPLDELRVLVDNRIWRALTGRRMYGFRDRHLGESVLHGCQALAIDDERQTFHPNVWECREGVEQVWFAGAHSNVGGGYPKDAMSLVPMLWMMERAEEQGLRFKSEDVQQFRREADVDAKLYDSRAGAAVFYRLAPRDIEKLDTADRPAIHPSVYRRIEHRTELYAPGLIPPAARALRDTSDTPTKSEPKLDPGLLDRVRRQIRARRGHYFLFVLVNLCVVCAAGYGWWRTRGQEPEPGSITSTVSRILPELPGNLQNLIVSYPWITLAVVCALVVLRLSATRLRRRTRETALEGWRTASTSSPDQPSAPG